MVYRTEHPKPQFERAAWENLNGKWEFAFDHGNSGAERGMHLAGAEFPLEIEVPFCPQSKLSGLEYTDFLRAIWYRRTFSLEEKALQGRVILHFGAVDYRAFVYVNGKFCGSHKGGYSSFSMDITDFVTVGENLLVVRAEDNERDRMIPGGKQSEAYASQGCFYTRTTGIWQTVWLEFVPTVHIVKAKYYPDAVAGTLTAELVLRGTGDLTISTSFEGKDTGKVTVPQAHGCVTVSVPLKEKHLWQVGVGGLYDVTLQFGEDVVKSYFGLRSVEYQDYKFLLNGKSVFQRLVLDQGFYPDGIYTAPSDAALEADIDLSVAMGFNGARLHEKVFEERFLYHCDRKGYLVWGEFPNWGLDHSYADAIYGILPEWLEVLERDFNHPSIIGWCPFNETWDWHGRKQYDDLLRLVYQATKTVDYTRPCIDTSGMYHVKTDIYDVHDYEQNPEKLREHFANMDKGEVVNVYTKNRTRWDGKMPFFVSEYGGIKWSDKDGWGYGDNPTSVEEFLERLKALTDVLLDNPMMFGFCYTQLVDVEQEQNGLYSYDRIPKFDPAVIAPIFSRKAAIEE